MSKVHKRTFSLTSQQSAYVDARVATGDYASGSELIREGLRMMQERDTAMQRWVKEKVEPAYDEWVAQPDDVRSAEEVFDELEAELAAFSARKAS